MSDLATPSGPAPVEEREAFTVDEAIPQELVERARSEGTALVGPGRLLTGLTKTVLEARLVAVGPHEEGMP